MSTTAGIDIGSDSIKGVVLRAGKTGPVEIIGAGTMPISDLGRMPDSPDKKLAVAEKLKELVKSARLRADVRRVGASGGNTSMRYLQIPPVPPWRLEMLVKYEVEERSEEKEANAYAYHIMDVPESNGQYTVIVGMSREAYTNDLLEISRSAGLGEVEIDLDAMALFAAYYHGHGFDADKTVAIADIGAEDITILVCKNGALYYARSMLGGGRRFTQNLADDLKLDFNEAEELKKSSAEIVFEVSPAAASTTGRVRLGRTGATTMLPRKPGQSAPNFQGPIKAAPPPKADEGEKRVAMMPEFGDSMVSQSGSGALPSVSAPLTATKIIAPAPKDDFELQPAEGEKKAGPKPTLPPAARNVARAPAAAPFKLEGENTNSGVIELMPSAPSNAALPTKQAVATPASNLDDDLSLPPSLDDLDPNLTTAEKYAVMAAQANYDSHEDKEKRRRQISASLVREAAGICAAIENVVVACKQQCKQPQLKVDRLYITGGGSRLKGLPEFMGRRLRMEVQSLEPLKCLSLARLSPKAVDALKSEQHSLAVPLGLALSDLREGAHNFLLWPAALKKRKDFWAREAYLYYAAGAAALAMGILLYTPARNTDLLARNYGIADSASRESDRLDNEIKEQERVNKELRHRLSTVTSNVQSGDYFLTVLAELKSSRRIPPDIYLTSISTSIPKVVLADADSGDGVKNVTDSAELIRRATEANRGEPTSFQAQRRVYIRGFARGREKEGLIERIRDFYNKLVIYPNDPDNPQNVFKDIRPIWYSIQDNYEDREKELRDKELKEPKVAGAVPEPKKDRVYLKEFVLEAYTDNPAKEEVKAIEKKKLGKDKGGKAVATKPAEGEPDAGAPDANAAPVATIPVAPAAPSPAAPADDGLLPYLKNLFRGGDTKVAPAPVIRPSRTVPVAPIAPIAPVAPVVPLAPVQVQPNPAAPLTPGLDNPNVTVPAPIIPAPAAPVEAAPALAPATPLPAADDARPAKKARQFVTPGQ